MSRKKSKPKNSRRINRRQETIDRRSLGSLKYLEYQIHAEQVPQSKENRDEVRENRIEGGIRHE